jgi:hypothetical protein
MATTVNTLPALHRDHHEEVDKPHKKMEVEVSTSDVAATDLQENIAANIEVVQVLAHKLVTVGGAIQVMVKTAANLADNVKRIKHDHGIERNCLSKFSNHACLKAEVKSALVHVVEAMEELAPLLSMSRESFHKSLFDSTRRIITPPKTLLTAGHTEAFVKIMGKGGFESVEEWFHTERSGDYCKAVENPGYRLRSPPKAPATFLRVMKESSPR